MAKESIDTLFEEIVRLRNALEETVDTAERIELGMRLRELKIAVSARSDTGLAGLTLEQLSRQIQRIERELGQLADRRFAPGTIAATGEAGGGLDPVRAIEHNNRVDSWGGRGDLELSLRTLRDELGRRRGDR